MTRHASWQLDGSSATLRAGALTARLDLRHPELGLTQLALVGARLAEPAGILAVCAPTVSPSEAASPLDAYHRGPDVIATYGPTAAHPFRYQVYWRAQLAQYPDALAAIELVVSIQTHLLDSRPRLTAASLLPASAARHWQSVESAAGNARDFTCPPPECRQFGRPDGIGCFSFRLAGVAADYAEMVHPVDFQLSSLDAQAQPAAPPATRLAHQLFAGQLEKGVILRSRVLGLFLPAGTPNGMIAQYYRSFVDEEPPLTT